MAQKVYFHPHKSLRDRQLDTIRGWRTSDVVNLRILDRIAVAQASPASAMVGRIPVSWKQKLPLVNIKRRPAELDANVAVYHWGAIADRGPFILDLDNPYALVGYNLRAMPLWKPLIKRVLLSRRCLQIRCMSDACRRSLRALFGDAVAAKAEVCYPRVPIQIGSIERPEDAFVRFLFVGTQFEIKGGAALLRAWPEVVRAIPGARLDMVTHLPNSYVAEAAGLPGLTLHEARFSRSEIWSQFMKAADVLVLPTYVESFGMAALEGLAHGLALVVSDVYALPEMVEEGKNGFLVTPPLSIWDKDLAAPPHYRLAKLSEEIAQLDTDNFVAQLSEQMKMAARIPDLEGYRRESLKIFCDKFQAKVDN